MYTYMIYSFINLYIYLFICVFTQSQRDEELWKAASNGRCLRIEALYNAGKRLNYVY